MIDRAEAYYYFWETIQTITDLFDYVQTATHDWDAEIDSLSNRLEAMSDKVIKIAAEESWAAAINDSGIRELWAECQRLMDDEFADYFRI